MSFAELALPALAANLVLGLLVAAGLSVALRFGVFERRAGARFSLWFCALATLLAAIPFVVTAGNARLHDLAPIAAPSAPLHVSRALPADAPPAAARRIVDARALPELVALLWIAGIIAGIARIALGMLRLTAMLGGAELLERRATPRGSVRVLVANCFSVPIAVGYRRPAIVVPAALRRALEAGDLENVILHEIEHLRRFDDVTALLQAVSLAVLWFNPFAHYFASRLSLEREMACDEAVVALTGKRRTYAATLWTVAAFATDRIAPAFSAFASRPQTVPRLENLLRARAASPPRSLRVVAVLALLGASVVALTVAAPAMLYGKPGISAFAIVRLGDGSSLVIGGRYANGGAVRYAQLYDRAGQRIALLPMHVARWSETATMLHDGDVLVAGGVTDVGVTASAEIYDPERRAFVTVSPMHAPRVGHTATQLPDGRVVVAAGERSAERYVAATEIYDPVRRRFSLSADGAKRIGQTALLVDRGNVLMFGGRRRNRSIRCAIIYDPRIDGYRDAGSLVAADSRTMTFELPNGQKVLHHIRSS